MAYFLLLIVLYRVKRQARPLVSMGVGLVAGWIILLLVPLPAVNGTTARLSQPLVSGLAAVIFVGIVYGYFQFYGLIQYSISFKILRQLYRGAESQESLLRARELASLLDVKVAESRRMGLLAVETGANGTTTVRNTAAGSRYARLFLWIKQQMNWGLGG